MPPSLTWAEQHLPNLEGHIYLVTGANSGLGHETTRLLAHRGARVIMACRSEARQKAAEESIRASVPDAHLQFLKLDLADLSSIMAAAELLEAYCDHIDGLINNAGVMAPPLLRTAQVLEMQLGTNHFGHFALTSQLWPLLEASRAGRVVHVASVAHRLGSFDWSDLQWERSYRRWPAYGRSKLANLLFHNELTSRTTRLGSKVRSYAAHPGYSSTNLQQRGAKLDGSGFWDWFYGLANRFIAQEAWMGALPTLWAATHPTAIPGAYYGPSGLFELWGFPKRVYASAAANNVHDRSALWQASEAFIGQPFLSED